MKKLLAMVLVLGVASIASAANVSWSQSSIELNVGETAGVQIMAGAAGNFDAIWIDDSAAGLIAAIQALPTAGRDAVVQNPTESGYAGWWTVATQDLNPDGSTLGQGPQYDVVLSAVGVAEGSYTLYLDSYGVNAPLEVNVVPEPITMSLLGLGGLVALRRRNA